LLLLDTGVGRSAVHAALDWLLAGPLWPSFVLYAGFAGALDPTLQVGDVLFADEVVDAHGGRWPATWLGSPPNLLRGRLLTVSRLVASAEEKRRLGALHRALAVDMEAAYAAERCAEHGVPFGCIRSVSDCVDTPLSPALVEMLSLGRVAPMQVVKAIVRRPTLIGELCRLGRDTRRAARRLSDSLLQVLPPDLRSLDRSA
jgi:nucleoside phosphorylase